MQRERPGNDQREAMMAPFTTHGLNTTTSRGGSLTKHGAYDSSICKQSPERVETADVDGKP